MRCGYRYWVFATDPTGYGRIMVDDDFVDAIVECKECDEEQKQVNLCYSGIMAVVPIYCLNWWNKSIITMQRANII